MTDATSDPHAISVLTSSIAAEIVNASRSWPDDVRDELIDAYVSGVGGMIQTAVDRLRGMTTADAEHVNAGDGA